MTTIQEMLSTFLANLGFSTMAADVLNETENDRLSRYAKIIVRNLPQDKKLEVLNRFRLLKLA